MAAQHDCETDRRARGHLARRPSRSTSFSPSRTPPAPNAPSKPFPGQRRAISLNTNCVARISNDAVLAAAMSATPAVLATTLTQGARASDYPAKAGIATAGDDPRRFMPRFTGSVVPLPDLERRRRRCGAASRSARSWPSRGRRPCHVDITTPRDARTPARAPRPAHGDQSLAAARHDHVEMPRGRRASCRPPRGRASAPVESRPPAGRRRAAPRPAPHGSRAPSGAFRAAAQDRRIAGLQAQHRGVGRHVRAALVDHADHAERHAHALDRHAVRPRPAVRSTAPTGSASMRTTSMPSAMAATRFSSSVEPVDEGRMSRPRLSLRRHPRHWRRGCRLRWRGSPAPLRRALIALRGEEKCQLPRSRLAAPADVGHRVGDAGAFDRFQRRGHGFLGRAS